MKPIQRRRRLSGYVELEKYNEAAKELLPESQLFESTMAAPLFWKNVFDPFIDSASPVKNNEAVSLMEKLRTTSTLPLHELHGIWKSRPLRGWVDHPGIYRLLGEQSL